MSVIRPLKPRPQQEPCPYCGIPNSLFVDDDRKLTCKFCDWKSEEPVGDASSYESPDETPTPEDDLLHQLHQKDEDVRDQRQMTITYYVGNRAMLSPWGLAAYETAIDHIKRKEWDDAIHALQRAIDNDSDFIEARLWLGRLLTEEAQQREQFSHIVALQPQHSEALLELMYLNGQITLSQLEHALYDDGEIETKTTSAPVKSQTAVLSCPICGGHMTTDPVTGTIECAFCGHIEDDYSGAQQSSTVGESLTSALLLQRSEGVKWVIGDRVLYCKNCGAECTIPEGQMGIHCMYCGSNHIIEQDALNSFRQPDGIIPFTIPQEQAEQIIEAKLTGRWERFKGLFTNNRVDRAMFSGTYLPFWVFDVILDVKLHFNLKDTSRVRYGAQPARDETRTEVFNNFPFPAVLSPSPRLIEKIVGYDYSTVKPYDTGALARYPAELYKIDFDKASLEVRGRMQRTLRDRLNSETAYSQVEELSSVMSLVRNIQFRLLLLPVWVATLIEEDGDVRIGLVNGQTGDVALGKAHQPK